MTYRTGLLLLTAAILLSSFNGIILRFAGEPEPWPAVIVRYAFQTLGLLIFVIWTSRGRLAPRFAALRGPGVIASLCYGLGSVGFIAALTYTTIAEAMFAISTLPVATAVMARLILGESVRPTTWIAMAGAGVGIVVMFGDGGASGQTLGLVMAVGCVLFMAGFGVGLRWGRSFDMSPSIVLGSAVAAAVGFAIAPGSLDAVPWRAILIYAVWGLVLASTFNLLFVIGSRVVPAGEMMLFVFVEVVLSPFWVWLAVDEVPARQTLIGGAIVLASLAVFVWTALRRPRAVATG